MGFRGPFAAARWVLPVAVIPFALSLALGACSSDPLTGAWTPQRGSLDFSASGGGANMTWNPNAAKPAGGVIVVESGDSYHVTLVSADGQRIPAAEAQPQDGLLRVRVGATVEFFLSPRGGDAVQMMEAIKGSPAPQAWSIELVPGPLLEGGQ